jgi:hypothetical protein
MILFYLSIMLNVSPNRGGWFPVTFIYREYSHPIKLLARLKSKRRAESILDLFGFLRLKFFDLIFLLMSTNQAMALLGQEEIFPTFRITSNQKKLL